MPAAVGVWVANAVIGAVTAAGGIATVGLATAAYWTGAAVATLAISAGLAKVSAALAGRPKMGSGVATRRSLVRDAALPRTILYGTGRTGGLLVYANTTGDKNEYMDVVIALAGHEITAITDVWFDDDKIDNADINGGAAAGGAVGGTNKYAGRAWIYKYLGGDGQTASSILTTAYPSEWTTDHRGRGNAYVHIRMRRDKDVFTQGAPGTFTFGFQGAKVYDPRLDSTNGGTGAHRITDPSTWAYSNNPALCVADYIIGGSITNSATRVNLRGFGADPADVDWVSVINAANVCDEDVAIPGSTTQNRYECDGALSMGEYPAESLEQLLTSMMGQVAYSAGKYRVYPGAYATPTMSLNESDLAGAIEYATGTSRAERYNAVKGTRYDTASAALVEFLPRTSSAYETEDGGVRLYRDIELPFTLDEYRAQRIAQIILRRSREQSTLVWRGNLGCLRVGVWETVQVTVAELGLAGKVFRCLSREFKPAASGGEPIVELTLREENSSTYTDPLVADYGALNPATPAETPDDYVDLSGDLSVVFDPEFTYAEGIVPLYWDTGGTVSANGASGTVILYPDGVTSPQVRTKHLRTFPAQLGSAWAISFTVRYRVAAALTGSNHRAFLRVYAAGEDWTDGQTLCDSYTIDLSGATEGAWYTVQTSLDYAPDGTKDRIRVQLIVDSADVTDGEVEFDYCYGFRQSITIDPGDAVEPITGYLTNESCTVPASYTGAVDDWSGAVGQFKVYKGTTEVTSLATFAEVSEAGCVGTINTAVNTPVTGQPRGYYRMTAISTNTGRYTMSATYEGVTIEKVFTVTKAVGGGPGTEGPEGPPGASPLTITLSKPAVSLLTFANGDVESYAPATGQATVRSGTTDVTSLATLSAVASGCTGSVNTANGTPVAGQSKGYYRVTAMSADSATLTIYATYNGTTVSAEFAVSKTGIGYEIVDTLPVTNLFNGRMVFLTTDGKLYRYVTGTGWTAAVPTVDLIGTITETQIANDSISTPKLQANSVLANNIAANQINSNHVITGAITTDKIAAGAITAAKIAANTITASQIQAGTITANEIGNQTLTTGKFAALSVTNAIIGDLAVDTIKIANSAVTESSIDDANLGGGTVVTTGGVRTAVSGASVTVTNIPSANAKLRIDVAFNAESYGTGEDVTISLRRADGTWFDGPLMRLQNGRRNIYSWAFVDTNPPAGTTSYALYVLTTNSQNAGKWYEIRLAATVLKK